MKRISRSHFIRKAGRYSTGLAFWGLAGCESRSGKEDPDDNQNIKDISMESTRVEPYAKNLGIQLYTLRDQVAADKKGTLEKVAAIGYKQVELYDPTTIRETAAMAGDLGLEAVATHILPGFLTNNWQTVPKPGDAGFGYEKILDSCASAGVKNVGVAVLFPEDRPTLGDYHRFAEMANIAGEKAKAMGIQFYYHNHSFEFEPIEGTTPYDVLTGAFDPDLVKLEIDIFWVKVSGHNPAELVGKLGPQVLALHIKDLKPETPRDYEMQVAPEAFMPVGQGMIDIREVLTAAHEVGVPYGFVEQDHHAVGDPFDNIKLSYQYLQELGL